MEGMGDSRYFSLYNEYLIKLLSEILNDTIFIAFQYQMPTVVSINHIHTLAHIYIFTHLFVLTSSSPTKSDRIMLNPHSV